MPPFKQGTILQTVSFSVYVSVFDDVEVVVVVFSFSFSQWFFDRIHASHDE